MKKFRFFALCVICAAFSIQAVAQDECMLYLSYYQEYYKQGTKTARNEALPSWRKAYNLCAPGTRQNLYVHGAELYRMLIAQNAKNPEYKAALVDTLLTLHQIRAQYYPTYAKKAYAALSKDVNNYLKNDPVRTRSILYDVMEKQQGDADPSTFLALMNASVALYKDGKLSAEDVINDYDKASGYFSACQKIDTTQQTRDIRATFENAFINSKIASCDNLKQIFGSRFDECKDDYDMVSRIVKIMATAEDDCTDNELFMKAVTQMHKLQPSASSAYYLFRLHASRQENSKALAYVEEALASDDLDVAQKAQYSYEMAAFCLKNCMFAKAVDAANKAMNLDSSYKGKANMVIGHAWMSIVCGGNEVERRAKYWVAVDYFNRAKAADASLAEDANKQIGACSAYFPATAEAFMYDVQNGQSFTVSCGGMRAVTTVRTH